MRDILRDPKYKAQNNIPFGFQEGDEVEKVSGYKFIGIILACFRNRSGSPRYIVENDDGIIHIFNYTQLRRK